eukprot:CAMPEP_0174706354 /NCGR_PEP_ID=MMETSP1094-20130205/9232_1 /TAXON_ID=156173 /ORGANISM="Chrysochromulina brevifilum, Strain UTEX LB 985" /LENGTH=49 /DNA_ID=CAMNT_0015904609 /DNA_START=594 /DNA_END=743 /DNA_ORIENTATION=+
MRRSGQLIACDVAWRRRPLSPGMSPASAVETSPAATAPEGGTANECDNE